MVLCEIEASGSFFSTWVALTLMGLLSQIVFSGGAFWYYYVKPTYEMWRWKSNPEYPKPEKVRDEIVQMIKGLCSATLCPAASLYLARHNMSYGYCGLGDYSWGYLVVSFLATWLVSDFCTFTSSANSAALLQLPPPAHPPRALAPARPRRIAPPPRIAR
jgi:lathosterol oxidase